jgi:hypothetical protein
MTCGNVLAWRVPNLSEDNLMNSATTIPASQPVQIRSAGVSIRGDLRVPEKATGIVVFVHGGGSSRFGRRNRAVAEVLMRAHLGTLLWDLLTEAEERTDATTAEFRFDIPLLAERTTGVVDWVTAAPRTASIPSACLAQARAPRQR